MRGEQNGDKTEIVGEEGTRVEIEGEIRGSNGWRDCLIERR